MPERKNGERGDSAADRAGSPETDRAAPENSSAVSEAVQNLLKTLAETTPAGGPVPSKVRSDTVVVVEDDADMRHILQRVLQGAGYRVLAFASALEALGQINVSQTALIITDLAMPGMGGDLFIRRFKKSHLTRHIPIIAVTAFSDDTVGYRAKVAGCDDFIQKPFRSKQILEAIERHLRRGRSLPE
jgi:CheY-like chemotaxis protein